MDGAGQEAALDYRYVTLNSQGQAAHAEDWSCSSDVDAIERALQAAPPFGAELWRDDRQLTIVPPRLAAAPA